MLEKLVRKGINYVLPIGEYEIIFHPDYVSEEKWVEFPLIGNIIEYNKHIAIVPGDKIIYLLDIIPPKNISGNYVKFYNFEDGRLLIICLPNNEIEIELEGGGIIKICNNNITYEN